MDEQIPRYEVTELPLSAGVARAVRVQAFDTEPGFMDEAEPLELRAGPHAVRALQDYLEALPLGSAWIQRESRGLSTMQSRPVAGADGLKADLCHATNGKRSTGEWFTLLVGKGAEVPLEMCVRDAHLGRRLLDAVASGDLRLGEVAPAAQAQAKPTRRARP